MKISHLLSIGVLACCWGSPAAEAALPWEKKAPAAEAQEVAEVRAEATQRWRSTKIIVSFSEPMVEAAKVGQSADGVMELSPALPHKSLWLSESQLELELDEKPRSLELVRLSLAEGLKSLKGKPVVPDTPTEGAGERELTRLDFEGSIWIRAKYRVAPEEPLMFAAESAKEDDLLAEAVKHAVFRWGKLVSDKYQHELPATCRQVTVGEALRYPEIYEEATSCSEEQFAELKKLPQDQVLPHVWMTEKPAEIPAEEENIQLYLKERGTYYSGLTRQDEHVGIIGRLKPEVTLNTYTYHIENEFKWKIGLFFSRPCAVTDNNLAALMQQAEWSMFPTVEKGKPAPAGGKLRLQPDGQELVAHWQGKEIRLRVLPEDCEVTDAGCTRLTMELSTGGLDGQLGATGRYTLADGSPVTLAAGRYARLTFPTPRLNFNAKHKILRLGGPLGLGLYPYNVEQLRVRIVRAKPGSPAAVTAWNRSEGRAMYEEEHEAFDSGKTPGITATAEYEPSGKESPVIIDLADVFQEMEPGGMYYVGVEGDSKFKNRANFYTQYASGLVQVTNLGLMWKRSGNSLFAWAWQLSDAAPLAQGTITLLDKDGKELSRFDVKDGIGTADLPSGAEWMVLSSGNDSYMTRLSDYADLMHACDEYTESHVELIRQLVQAGIDPIALPKFCVNLFSDRNLYRPGETAHVKGFVRLLTDNSFSTPDIDHIVVTVTQGDDDKEIKVTPEPDGSFALDYQLGTGSGDTAIFDARVVLKSDADGSSADMMAMKAAGIDECEWADFLKARRTAGGLAVQVTEFQRNEFRVESKMDLDMEKKTITLGATATGYNGTPVSGGKVSWSVRCDPEPFYPAAFQDFTFGNWEDLPPSGTNRRANADKLDTNGQGSAILHLPLPAGAPCVRISGSVTVSNAKNQSISSGDSVLYHCSDVYAGLRCTSGFLRAGDSLELQSIGVSSQGEPWKGAPIAARLRVTRESYNNTWFSSSRGTYTVNSTPEEEEICTVPINLTGTITDTTVRTTEPGIYHIYAEGQDEKGRPFSSEIRRYVWGGDISPWKYHHGHHLEVTPEKAVYQPGETARLLVQTPVDARLLVTVERGKLLRHFFRDITVKEPVIEVPLEEGDGPAVYVSVFLVQKDPTEDSAITKGSTVLLRIDPADKRLNVALQAPEKAILTTTPCQVSGQITGPDGKPAPHATVTLFAVDEGTLDIIGYDTPDPIDYFYGQCAATHNVHTFHNSDRIISGLVSTAQVHASKGTFVGGGGASGEEDAHLREDFSPTAVWLSRVETDAEGRFTATWKNPDTLTSYRIMAVATDGADKFGTGETTYSVSQACMLEPSIPMQVTQGDKLNLPVTISMNPDMLPLSTAQPLKWYITAGAENATMARPLIPVTLTGRQPATIHMPVLFDRTGDVKITWRSWPAPMGDLPGNLRDRVALSTEVVPATPLLREPVFCRMETGQTPAAFTSLLQESYAPAETEVEITLSPSPFIGATGHVNYLLEYPYGCAEQLSSRLLAWMWQKEFSGRLGIPYPVEKKAGSTAKELLAQINSMQRPDGYFGFWGPESSTSLFSPYTTLVLGYYNDTQEDSPGRSYNRAVDKLKEDVKNGHNTQPLALFTLARAGQLSQETLDAYLKEHAENLTRRGKLTCALAALVADHPRRAELVQSALSARPTETPSWRNGDWLLPEEGVLELLLALHREDTPSRDTEDALIRYLHTASCRPWPSTWESGWLCILMHEYLNRVENSALPATVENCGEAVTAENPLKIRSKLQDAALPVVTQGTLYAYGTATGYLKDKQEEARRDRGFQVTRRYERLLPDGSWQPTTEFRTGDTVRVTLHAKTDREGGQFFVLEDRLPAAFEAINPALTTQALAPGLAADAAHPTYTDCGVEHVDFRRGTVTFHASAYRGGDFTATYLARVTRSGQVSAPAAKAEYMYRPDIYGLSIPQQFTITEEPEN